MAITGILLAAGRGRRFDATGKQHKLLAALPDGQTVAGASARALRSALPQVIAVVAEDGPLARVLAQHGCAVTVCADAGSGMAASLTHALRRAPGDASGWVIALADMPHVQALTVARLAEAVEAGADIAVPVYRGQRGNPVAFSAHHAARLLDLTGDQGARALLRTWPVLEVDTNDPGILRDIDYPEDLAASAFIQRGEDADHPGAEQS
ncbi:nucleotidyltransferase family protein [Massilia sp. PAMC28688]|uniref:nucleotidyltransferase family protein n=1 Tax=Massilia sp. PAMC28688 TaxID=2861283 RepID=UPI001C62AE6C|nr:nucleotidyltransferase family protein [Massilia sp. PAMC28688]QYF94286.1 nucleotidyltransferase family protein [Massilia sp. PAMC28688]